MTGSTVIDQSVLDTLKQAVGEDFIGELIDMFLSDAPRQIAEMYASLGQGNAEVFRRAAHSLKSNAANFGATPLAELALKLEMIGKSGNLLDVSGETMVRLEDIYRQAAEELRRLSAAD